MATLKFVTHGNVTDVSDAVAKLMSEHLTPNLPKEARQSSNSFRKRFCYIERTSDVLEEHTTTLWNLYRTYAGSSLDTHDDTSVMSVGEWLMFVRHVGLLLPASGVVGQLSLPAAKRVFLWSRMRLLPEHTAHCEERLRHWYYEDFLEGLVRTSMLCALPTETDLAEWCASAAATSTLRGARVPLARHHAGQRPSLSPRQHEPTPFRHALAHAPLPASTGAHRLAHVLAVAPPTRASSSSQ
jgi:hypothetical protein